MNDKLNKLLADLVVEYHKLQNFHWYVKGEDFFQAHAKLEEYYDGVNGFIDEVAEAILQVGGAPVATLDQFRSLSTIVEPAPEFVTSDTVLAAVREDFAALLDEAKDIKKEADEKEAYLISALMDELISEFSKSLWMLGQQAR